MILRELFYFDKQTIEPIEDKTYDATDDESIVKRDDTRKTRLTLRQINKARKMSEIHAEETEKELEFTELDINFLDVNFLEDLLDIVDALAIAEEEDKLKQTSGVNIVGTELGQDRDTQITTLVTGQFVSFRRNVNQNLRLDVDGSNAYTLIFEQDGVNKVVKVNGGSDSTISLSQQ